MNNHELFILCSWITYRQMEKRFGSARKSTRSPRPMEEPEHEIVPSNSTEGGMLPVQFRQEEMAAVRIHYHYHYYHHYHLLFQNSHVLVPCQHY